MRWLCLTFALFAGTGLFAQPQLTAENLDRLDIEAFLIESNPLEATPGPDGDAALWDFSAISVIDGSDYTLNRTDPITTPDGDMFPTASVAESQDFDGTVTYNYFNQVPEPGMLTLFALGLLAVGISRRRQSVA